MSSTAKRQSCAKAKWLSGLLLLALLVACPLPAQEADDQYLQLIGLIQQADTLSASGQRASARAKYLEACKGLKSFKQSHPDWNVKLVAARLKYRDGTDRLLVGATACGDCGRCHQRPGGET